MQAAVAEQPLFDVRQRRPVVLELALIQSQLAFHLRDARLDLAFALGHVLRIDDQLRALFGRERRIHDARSDGHQVPVDLLQLRAHRMQLVLSRADPRAQGVELPSRLIGIDERLVQLGRADAAVTRTARADTKAVRRLAELTQTVFATRLVQAQVGRDAVLAAGVAIATDAVARKAVHAVFVADRPPIGGQTFLCTHRIAAGEYRHRADDAEDQCVPGWELAHEYGFRAWVQST